MKNFDETFFAEFEKNLDLFHSVFTKCKLKAELLEELIYKSLPNKDNVEWVSGSHNQKYDIKIGDKTIQVKSGTVTKRGILKLSSHRSTKYEKIEEKVDFIKSVSSDLIFSFTNHADGYVCYIFDGKLLTGNLTSESFYETKAGWAYDTPELSCSISRKMSDQLWYNINLEKMGIKPIWEYKLR